MDTYKSSIVFVVIISHMTLFFIKMCCVVTIDDDKCERSGFIKYIF